MEYIKSWISYIAIFIEAIGVFIIVTGTVVSLVNYLFSPKSLSRSYKKLRQEIGRTILLGLEVLVAGDIISTVVTKPDMQSILALGVIVLIRTFLSFSIELEIEEKFPWQKSRYDKEV